MVERRHILLVLLAATTVLLAGCNHGDEEGGGGSPYAVGAPAGSTAAVAPTDAHRGPDAGSDPGILSAITTGSTRPAQAEHP